MRSARKLPKKGSIVAGTIESPPRSTSSNSPLRDHGNCTNEEANSVMVVEKVNGAATRSSDSLDMHDANGDDEESDEHKEEDTEREEEDGLSLHDDGVAESTGLPVGTSPSPIPMEATVVVNRREVTGDRPHSVHSNNHTDDDDHCNGSSRANDTDSEYSEDVDFEDLVVKDECFDENSQDLAASLKRCDSEPPQGSPRILMTQRSWSVAPHKYRRQPPIICGDSVEVEALMQKAQFFLARSCKENIAIAKERGMWTTNRRVEELLAEAFTKAPVVILVFFDKNADYFDGFAMVASKALYRGQPALRWKEFRGGGNILLQWVTRRTLPIDATRHIKNPFNKEREVFAGADGSEIQRCAGQRLCSLFPFEEGVDARLLMRGVKIRRRNNQRKRRANLHKRSAGRAAGGPLPSLLDARISFTQYSRARRNASFEKRYEVWEESELDSLYPAAPPRSLIDYGRREVGFDDWVSRPMSLMDLPLRSPPRIYEMGSYEGRFDRSRSPLFRQRSPPHSSYYRRRNDGRNRREADRSSPRRESPRKREHEGRSSYLDPKRKTDSYDKSSKRWTSHSSSSHYH